MNLQVIVSTVHSCPVWCDAGVGPTVGHLASRNPFFKIQKYYFRRTVIVIKWNLKCMANYNEYKISVADSRGALLRRPTGAPVQQKEAVCGRTVAVAGRSAASWAVEVESLWQHTQCWRKCPQRWSAPRLSHCCHLSQEALKNEWMQAKNKNTPFVRLWKSKWNEMKIQLTINI